MSFCKYFGGLGNFFLVMIFFMGFSVNAFARKNDSVKCELPESLKKFFSSEDVSNKDFRDFDANTYGELLEAMKSHYESNIKDYRGTFSKQERVNGKLLKRQVMEFKFRDEPFSIFLKWEKNPGRIDRLLYVEGENDGNMVVHPRGFLLGFVKSVERDPRSKEVKKSSLRTPDQFGIRNLLERVGGLYKDNRDDRGFKVDFVGTRKVEKRTGFAFEMIMPDNELSATRRLLLVVDKENCLPVSVKSLDDEGDLISKYSYSDLEFNVGLKDNDFSKKANNL